MSSRAGADSARPMATPGGHSFYTTRMRISKKLDNKDYIMQQQMYRNYLLSLIGLLLVYSALFLFVDKPVAYAIHDTSLPALTKFSKYISYLGEYVLWFIISVVGLLLIYFKIAEKYLSAVNIAKCTYVFSSILLAIIIGAGIKFILARYRPELLFTEGLYGFHFFSAKSIMNSTPSGHAFCIFAVCTSLSILFRRYTLLFFTIAILIGVSRIILLKHYVSDVVLGTYIGIIVALIMQPQYRWYMWVNTMMRVKVK